MINLTKFEQEVIDMCCAGKNATSVALQQQLASCVVVSRESSPAGFFTELRPDMNAPLAKTMNKKIVISDVVAEIPGLDRGAGFALFVEEGRLKLLEGFTFDEIWPVEISKWTLRYEPPRLASDTGMIADNE